MLIDPKTQQKSEQFFYQHLSTIESELSSKSLSSSNTNNIYFLRSCLMFTKNKNWQDKQEIIDNKLLDLGASFGIKI